MNYTFDTDFRNESALDKIHTRFSNSLLFAHSNYCSTSKVVIPSPLRMKMLRTLKTAVRLSTGHT